jgi:protein phosphatase
MHNEDVFVCQPPLYAVADGMGGAQAGELAASLAAAALAEASTVLRGEDAAAALVREANRRVYERSVEDPAAAGMGTTVTLMLVDEHEATAAVAHVGDSRAYRLRDGRLDQLTIDHSVVGELVRAGRLTEEEAFDHPYRSAITRVLGTELDVDVDTLTVELQPSDLYLVCSDGLTSMVRDEEIHALATTHAGNPRRSQCRSSMPQTGRVATTTSPSSSSRSPPATPTSAPFAIRSRRRSSPSRAPSRRPELPRYAVRAPAPGAAGPRSS